jgi:hypothetical protein
MRNRRRRRLRICGINFGLSLRTFSNSKGALGGFPEPLPSTENTGADHTRAQYQSPPLKPLGLVSRR